MHTSYDHHDPPPSRRTGTTDLSPREEEILRLIAEGRTDTKIGAALGISTDTVNEGRTYDYDRYHPDELAPAPRPGVAR